jgi:hypothetical protein
MSTFGCPSAHVRFTPGKRTFDSAGEISATSRAQSFDHTSPEDEKRRELNVVYEANLNGDRKRACEIMQFDRIRTTDQR